MPTTLHPTAGYILNVGQGAEPGPLGATERNLLRSLASCVQEISTHPKQAERRELWYRHNALEKVRPLVLVFPEDSWEEILPEDRLEARDPFWRQIEWYLRHLIYRDACLCDDFVVEPDLYVTRVVRGTGWGLAPGYSSPGRRKGSWRYEPPLRDLGDIAKLTYPTLDVDEAATERAVNALEDALGDLLPVRVHCSAPMVNLIGEATALRGIDRFMLDMHDHPTWTHELMAFLAEGVLRMTRSLEEGGWLTLNNRGHYNDSGGIGFTRELPSPGFDGTRVRLQDLWGFGVAQEAVGIGPKQHEEFLLDYQLRILQYYGLNAYGCCEPYTTKFGMLAKVPRLRRVSVSPWCDVEIAAENLGDRCIFSWKPNPALVATGFDEERIRSDIRHTLRATTGCVVEMVHKDTFTVQGDPTRLERWARIAREEIERQAG